LAAKSLGVFRLNTGLAARQKEALNPFVARSPE
jgi:hypothetical protein